MGIFSSLFGSAPQPDPIETALRDDTANMLEFSGMPKREAINAAQKLIEEAKELVATWPSEWSDPNYADRLVAKQGIDAATHRRLECLTRFGVTDEDVRWWWKLPSLERAMIIKTTDFILMAAYVAHRESGLDKEAALSAIGRTNAAFGTPRDDLGDHSPLPYELKRRVNAFIEQFYNKPDEFRNLLERSSSFNALVREGIRAGRI